MKTFKIVLISLLVILIVIQFFHPAKNISNAPTPNDISVAYNEPENVRTILKKACNDCHSNNTRYPWYNNIQPVAWWLDNHVQEGKHGLNFNEFTTYRISKQYHRMQDIIDEVKEGDMPLGSYTIVHTDARLTDQEKETLINWAKSIRSEMKAKYPADSLVRKK
ncbi:heme-binding domain-containing protein [Segetibacter koreensis]|uniref:heme-binding domain-containing protein n=1 Tax=Segetibacter koreensis TaxID=398037 RepID=UPI000377CCF3|nr:heme-binding domain-containing protein [Segetibacter koreensis]